MADFNQKAKLIFSELSEDEQKRAFSMLEALNGLEIERARRMLDFCKASLETKAVVQI